MTEPAWTSVMALEELAEGKPARVSLDGVPVLVLRTGDGVLAVGARCTHQGAPLERGAVRLAGSEATITCPAHGSTFRLSDGRVLRPPARDPIPTFDARISSDMVEIRPRS